MSHESLGAEGGWIRFWEACIARHCVEPNGAETPLHHVVRHCPVYRFEVPQSLETSSICSRLLNTLRGDGANEQQSQVQLKYPGKKYVYSAYTALYPCSAIVKTMADEAEEAWLPGPNVRQLLHYDGNML